MKLRKLTAVFLILLFCTGIACVDKTKYREILESVSPDGTKSLQILQNGDPDFPYGETRCTAVLYNDREEYSRTEITMLNDGKNAEPENFEIAWQTERAVLTVHAEEAEDQIINLYFGEAERFTFNPHVIPKEYIQLYGEGTKSAFFALCDAVLAAEDTFPCPNEEIMHRVLGIARTCFPPAAYFTDTEHCYVSDGTAHIAYTVDRSGLVSETGRFCAKVTDTLNAAIPQKTEPYLMAMELLTFLARKNTYAEDTTLDDFLIISPYRAIMEDTGICQELAGEYTYYLLQAGIDAFPCSALNSDHSQAHEWTVAELDGSYYHFDPTLTLDHPDSLFFFGMNDLQRSYYGDFPEENYTFADSDTFRITADSDRFLPLWLAESYTIDQDTGRITYQEIYSGLTKEYHEGD